MPGLIRAREAAVAGLRAALPEVRRIEGFAGELTMDAAALKNLPGEAVFVAVLTCRNAAPAETLDFDMLSVFGAFVLTRGRRNAETAETDGLALAERAALAIHGNTWGLPGAGPAKVLGLEPLNDEDMDARGLRVWSVTWQQNLVFDVEAS